MIPILQIKKQKKNINIKRFIQFIEAKELWLKSKQADIETLTLKYNLKII